MVGQVTTVGPLSGLAFVEASAGPGGVPASPSGPFVLPEPLAAAGAPPSSVGSPTPPPLSSDPEVAPLELPLGVGGPPSYALAPVPEVVPHASPRATRQPTARADFRARALRARALRRSPSNEHRFLERPVEPLLYWAAAVPVTTMRSSPCGAPLGSWADSLAHGATRPTRSDCPAGGP